MGMELLLARVRLPARLAHKWELLHMHGPVVMDDFLEMKKRVLVTILYC